MKKSTIGVIGTWIVGLSAIALSLVGLFGFAPSQVSSPRMLYGLIGLVAIAFLIYQRKRNKANKGRPR